MNDPLDHLDIPKKTSGKLSSILSKNLASSKEILNCPWHLNKQYPNGRLLSLLSQTLTLSPGSGGWFELELSGDGVFWHGLVFILLGCIFILLITATFKNELTWGYSFSL
jgi:hypothetical protein